MAELRLETLDQRTRYAPGEVIEGIAGWQVDRGAVTGATVRLFWRTEGKGTQDMGLGAQTDFDTPQATDARTFALTVPSGPWSHAGRLVAIVWALELTVDRQVRTLDVEIRP